MSFSYSNRTGKGVRVAVVDSGIAIGHPRIGDIAGGVSLRLEGGRPISGTDCADCVGHGTACAGIIHRKAPDAALYSVRVFDESLEADGRLLVAAIEWAIKEGMDVVNLSLGTTDPCWRSNLEAVCHKAVCQGMVIIAAEHNEGLPSYPALLNEVIGVAGGPLRNSMSYHYRLDAAIECVARGDAQRLCWLEPAEIMAAGTSFAAPHITGLVALIREALPQAGLEETREILRSHALPETSPPTTKSAEIPVNIDLADHLSWIKKAVLYPYNKEMHALVRGRDLLGFEIVGVADLVGKGLVGKDAGEVLGIETLGMRIQPRLESMLHDADTLIIGYVDELSRIRRKDVLRQTVETALGHGLNVFSLLALPRERYADLYETARAKGLHLYHPTLPFEDARRIIESAAESPQVDVPVLAIMGTGPQQGKFTLQIALRRWFLKNDYRVGQIGTEHHAELFAMDATFPMGHATAVNMPLDYYPFYLDAKMRHICAHRRPDIFIVGSQSGTIPYDVREPSTHTLPSLAFLMGTKPDACVLVVNSIDPEDYIRDTIDSIRALCQASVLALAMSDKEKHIRTAYGRMSVKPKKMSADEINNKLQHLEKTFRIPAISIVDEEGVGQLGDTVIRYFSACDERENTLPQPIYRSELGAGEMTKVGT